MTNIEQLRKLIDQKQVLLLFAFFLNHAEHFVALWKGVRMFLYTDDVLEGVEQMRAALKELEKEE